MNKGILKRYSLGVLCLIGSLVSCSEEQPATDSTLSTGLPVEMRLQVNAPLGSAAIDNNETAIHRLRMVVFGSVGGSDAGKLVLNKFYPTVPSGNSLKEIIASGRRDIYLIVNEPLSGGGEELDSYKKITTVADVRKLSLAYLGTSSMGIYTPTEIPMFAEHLNQQLRVDALSEIDGEVERTLAKVTLNLNIKNANFTNGKQPVVIDHITIKNLPSFSYLIAQNYTGALVNSEEQAVEGVVPAKSGYDFSSTNTFYVPEYLFNDPSKGAYIEIIGHVSGEPSTVTKYRVKLGDAMDDGNRYGDKYYITRNRHYTFTGDVKSYGEIDGVEVKVTVAPWNTVDMGEEVGRYIAFSKVTHAYTGNEIAEWDNLDDMGAMLRVECSTNTGGWYTVTRNAMGAIVHQSYSTESVSTVTSQTVDITIPRIGELPYLQRYNVGIYHRTIAQESVGPVKALDFFQCGGFIPRTTLFSRGWPADKLPPNGLHLAKRGDKVLPSGVPESDDPRKQWKTWTTYTPGTAMELGMGVSSTAAMAGAEHPAAQYCREMGEGWFLPSKDELKLIYDNQSDLGASYAFYSNIYWSATEDNLVGSWCVGMGSSLGTAGNVLKTNGYRVRCVRAI